MDELELEKSIPVLVRWQNTTWNAESPVQQKISATHYSSSLAFVPITRARSSIDSVLIGSFTLKGAKWHEHLSETAVLFYFSLPALLQLIELGSIH